ncbi:hypothetical protein COU00_00335 [Candidatus Falkowbacteria bacterium CG10_big_fil_rev_8_21_14_0_10_43_11]|uniref:Uncharacterized protein n=1 Tax=Candidatus Falkowbacteria bacterium CG10_big_fil_rev_8_21_14_0_10_43_11 TaxID=1974568 RepID=A0A2M6WN25_9BACT|nr:MAG: hypothetical protein COU00_00335 [Candidatus Falkowbacteria bacterium CG10_big_fil_rev_8_21_14_0_10_43_11]
MTTECVVKDEQQPTVEQQATYLRREWELRQRFLKGGLPPEWVLDQLQAAMEFGGNWLERILNRERQCYRQFFGQEFDLEILAEKLQAYGEEKIQQQWKKLGLEPHFLPQILLAQDSTFPGWKVKPEKWFYQEVDAGEILRQHNGGSLVVDHDACQLEGIAVLIDTRLKPAYDNGQQMYKDYNLLGPVVERLRQEGKISNHTPQTSRFNVSADEGEKTVRPALAEFIGLPTDQLRLERTIEANVISQLYPNMPRKNDGQTNTWVWYEEYFSGRGFRLRGGDAVFGGLAFVNHSVAGSHWVYESFRPLAVL